MIPSVDILVLKDITLQLDCWYLRCSNCHLFDPSLLEYLQESGPFQESGRLQEPGRLQESGCLQSIYGFLNRRGQLAH